MPTEGTHTMRDWISIIVLLCSLHGAGAQTKTLRRSITPPAIPFNIKLLSPRARVETLLKEHKFAVNSVPQVEGVALVSTQLMLSGTTRPLIRCSSISLLHPAGQQVSPLVRVCDDDKTGLIAAELTDVVSHSYGDPTYADETTARWERGNLSSYQSGSV
ncbi:MAG: hypothetical protein IPM83_16225 [Ignavibacteria bacterium]|nr:hypothetical protein [Ignavibacteria bacterium]